MTNSVPVDQLSVSSLKESPVWQFTNTGGSDGLLVRPVEHVPVTTLAGRIVGSQVRFANGDVEWAIIGNIDESNHFRTEHFITLSVERQGHWIRLARYHDHDYSEQGPEGLARRFELDVDQIFPISYDVRDCVRGDERSLVGKIPKYPQVKLSRDEIIALAVP